MREKKDRDGMTEERIVESSEAKRVCSVRCGADRPSAPQLCGGARLLPHWIGTKRVVGVYSRSKSGRDEERVSEDST